MGSKLILGSAQFGQQYGITNQTGLQDLDNIIEIIDFAKNIGIKGIDTASVYGDAEKKLGTAFSRLDYYPKVTTKIKFEDSNIFNNSLSGYMEAEVDKSLDNFGMETIDTLLLHDFSDYYKNQREIEKTLDTLRKKKKIKNFGVSIYSPKEALICLSDKKITALQIPFNILDKRWLSKELLKIFNERNDVEIQARSIFLQGLLLNDFKFWPKFSDSQNIISILHRLKKKFAKKSLLDLCLSYVNSYEWISGLVIGVDNLNQFKEISSFQSESFFSDDELDQIVTSFGNIPLKLLDPRVWHE